MKLQYMVKPNSFRTRMILYYASLIIGIFVVGNAILYFCMTSFAEDLVSDYTLETIKQTNGKLDSVLYQMESLSKAIQSNPNVLTFLDEYEQRKSEYRMRSDIQNHFATLTLPRHDISAIYLLKDMNVALKYHLSSSIIEDLRPDTLRKELSENDTINQGGVVFIGPIEKAGPEREFTIAAVSKVYNLFLMKQVGELVIEIRHKQLSNILDDVDIGNNGSLFLVDSKGKILFSSQKTLINTSLDNAYWEKISEHPNANTKQVMNNHMLLTFNKSSYTNWYILAVIPLEKVFQPVRQVQSYFLIVSMVGISIALLLAFMLSRSFTRPLTELVLKMKGVKQGDLRVKAKNSTYDEIQELNNNFNEMMSSLNRMIQEVYEAKIGQKEAELKALQAQINPHFLYNTLDVINWMAVVKEQQDIAQLVRALSNLLRYNISDGDRTVKVSEEISQICNYLDIQKARFGEGISYKTCLEPEVLDCKVKKFLLQPIVENAVIHGIKNQKDGQILIRGYMENDLLIFEVVDNGRGMDKETVNALLSGNTVNIGDTSGIGMKNINQQMKLYYGKKYGIQIESNIRAGTKVKLVFPVNDSEQTKEPIIVNNF